MCGGASSRMGRDKGLLQWNGETFAARAYRLLTQLAIPVVVSVNRNNFDLYAAHFSSELLIADNDALAVGGPLKGLLSVHRLLPDEDLLVIAVDMPQMEISVMQQLIDACGEQQADAFAFQSEKGLEPLCAIYTAKGLRKLSDMLNDGKLPRFSMHYILSQMNTMLLPLNEQQQSFFTNYNEPSDLAKLGL